MEEEDQLELEELLVEPQKVMDWGDMTFHNTAPDDLEEDFDLEDSFKDPDYQEPKGPVSSSSESNQELEDSFPAFMEEGRKRKRQDNTNI